MPVKRRKPKVRIQVFPDRQVRFMETGQEPSYSEDINEFEVIHWRYYSAGRDDPVRPGWEKVGERMLSPWCKSRPGTRPYAWWEYDAPRESIGTWPGTH